MAATLDEVLTLAKNTHALSQEQLSRILALAPEMSEDDLERLKNTLLGVREAEMKGMKHELDVRKNVAAAHHGWKAAQNRDALKTEEGAVKREDSAQAEALIQNI